MRLLRMVLATLGLFLALTFYAPDLYTILAGPLLARLPQGGSLIATEVTSPFLVPLKLALMCSLFIAMPYLLYQVWAFIAPGLYRREQRLVMPLLLSSVCLFYLGVAFCYFVVLPILFVFIYAIAPADITIMTDIGRYLDFCMKLFFAFGLAFEIPVVIYLLVRTGVCRAETLTAKRPLVVVLAFFIGMLLTPPDVISQFLVALPVWLLYEVGLVFARRLPPAANPEIHQP